MSFVSSLSRPALAFAATLCVSVALAQDKPAPTFTPEVGQPGKDVVWVPTPQSLVDAMLDVVKVNKDDYVIDLGSGDGRTVITAAKRGIRALGIEYNPDMVELAKRNAAAAGVSDRASFVKADIFEADFSKATVITMFLLNDINVKLRPRILDLKPGTRIVSNTFRMGDWDADQEVSVTKDCPHYCTAYHWVVPAKVAGRWNGEDGTLTLKQTYQKIEGSFSSGSSDTKISSARLRGADIVFSVGGKRYTPRVSGNGMEGSAGGKPWKATRAAG